MKKYICIQLTLLGVGLLMPNSGHSQGKLFATNLKNQHSFESSISSDLWLSTSFRTGNNEMGYILNSVDLLMLPATGTPEGFSLSLYDSAGATPRNKLGSFIGSDPAAGGIFNYSSADLQLESSTIYFLVAASATLLESGAYNWSAGATSLSETTEEWDIGPYTAFSPDGGVGWDRGGGALQFGIYATAIPEPSTFALIGGGAALLAFRWRRRRKD